MYLAVNTRPDIMFVTNSLARYLTNYTADQLPARHPLLKGTANLPFVNSKERLGSGELSAWVDADWATCRTTRRSVSGYVCRLHGRRACGLGVYQADWRRQFLVRGGVRRH